MALCYILVNIGKHLVRSAMAKNTSISLGVHFEAFISDQIATGRYGSASEVVRAALRAFEDVEFKREKLRAALIEGEKSGFTDYSYEALIAELDEDG